MNEWMLGAIAVGAIVLMLGGGGWIWRVATKRAGRSANVPVAVAEAAAKKAKAAV